MQNNIESIRGRLTRGMSALSDSDVRLLLHDVFNRLEELENAETKCSSGSCPVPGGEDCPAGTGKRGRRDKSDDAGTKKSRTA